MAMRLGEGLITLEQVVAEAQRHEIEHPTHGINCACMDNLIRQARRLTRVQGAALHEQPDENWHGINTDPDHAVFGRGRPYRQQARVDYVLKAATQNRY